MSNAGTPEPYVDRQVTSESAPPDEATATDSTVGTPAGDNAHKLPTQDEEYWLEDGNLTLIARDVEFRVYKGPLVANSLVFKDMLSLPQPDGHSSLQCTCGYKPAVVHVSDSPEDLRYLLRALLPGKTPRVTPDNLSFSAVSACIRLGHKYEIEQVVQRSLDYLKKFYAESVDTWARVAPPHPPSFKGVHAIGVVNIARLTGTDALLPTALMGCCMLSSADLINGFTREDGTLEKLGPDDVGRCFVGRANLIQANTLATLCLFNQTLSEACTRRDVCAPIFLKLLDELRSNDRVVCTLEWFKYCSTYIDERDDDRRLCAPCYRMLQEREKQQHREIWKKLPELMGVTVEGWAANVVPSADAQPTADGPTQT